MEARIYSLRNPESSLVAVCSNENRARFTGDETLFTMQNLLADCSYFDIGAKQLYENYMIRHMWLSEYRAFFSCSSSYKMKSSDMLLPITVQAELRTAQFWKWPWVVCCHVAQISWSVRSQEWLFGNTIFFITAQRKGLVLVSLIVKIARGDFQSHDLTVAARMWNTSPCSPSLILCFCCRGTEHWVSWHLPILHLTFVWWHSWLWEVFLETSFRHAIWGFMLSMALCLHAWHSWHDTETFMHLMHHITHPTSLVSPRSNCRFSDPFIFENNLHACHILLGFHYFKVCRLYDSGTVSTNAMETYYAQRAAHHAGLIITEGTIVMPEGHG